MMAQRRLIVAIIIIPVLVLFVSIGGWVFAVALSAVVGIAAWEYWHLFSTGGYHPSPFFLVAGAAGMLLLRHALAFEGSDLFISLILVALMGWQLKQYEKGCQTPALDFGITVGGILYIGWLGAYMISLRDLPDGLFWVMTVIPAIAISDGGAYYIGSRFGKHKISPRASPNKSWEGYLAGILTGTFGAMLLAALWHLRAPAITAEKGLIIGLVVSILSPFGDLGESMLKRSFGVKDTSNFLPGHGGIMDRIDSWLWAAPIGYYLIIFMLR
jgi:phosphatidate cytidylyltransferase